MVGDMRYRAAGRLARLMSALFARNFEKNLKMLLFLLDFVAVHPDARDSLRKVKWYYTHEHSLYKLLLRLSRELNHNAKKALMEFILNAWFLNKKIREQFREEEGFNPPQLLVISPTERCNLRCEGCWAGMYPREKDMNCVLLERIIAEAQREMGISFFVISGGEPFVREDLLDLYEKFDRTFFMIYTNGTLIDDDTVHRLAQLGNVAPMLSLDGFETETDARRGRDVYRKVVRTMEMLRDAGILFGFSTTADRLNVDIISSRDFIGHMLDKGCFWGWYFHYIPIGRDPDPERMLLPHQRNELRQRICEARRTLPILLVDFWNDGPQVGGCIAGGRYYLHVNCSGDVEPCVFCHFAVENVKSRSLREALRHPFLAEMRKNIPYDGNTLRPCMLIDRPWIFRDYYRRYRPYPTHPGAESLVGGLTKELDKYAQGVAQILDRVWENGDYEKIVHVPEEEM